MSDIAVRALTERDWLEVETIYREGIAAGNATFESEPPSWAGFPIGSAGGPCSSPPSLGP